MSPLLTINTLLQFYLKNKTTTKNTRLIVLNMIIFSDRKTIYPLTKKKNLKVARNLNNSNNTRLKIYEVHHHHHSTTTTPKKNMFQVQYEKKPPKTAQQNLHKAIKQTVYTHTNYKITRQQVINLNLICFSKIQLNII